MNKSLRGLMCLVLLLGALGPGLPHPMAAAPVAPVESGVYEEDFNAYTYKDISDEVEWDIFNNRLIISRRDAIFRYRPVVIGDGDAGYIVVWEDYRNGNWDIYAQRLDDAGNRFWEEDVRVNSDIGSAMQGSPATAMDVSGRVVVVWTDYRNGDADIYAQCLDNAGNRLFAQDVRVNSDSETSYQYAPNVSANSNGGFFIAWSDRRNAVEDVYVQLLNSFGSKQWQEDVQVNSDVTSGGPPVISTDLWGNAVVAWRSKDYPNILAQRLDSNGNTLWPEDIRVNNSTEAHSRFQTSISTDESGNSVVLWKENTDNTLLGDIYAQKVSSTGSRVWSQDVHVNTQRGSYSYLQPKVFVDLNNIIVVWTDNAHVRVQKLDINGVKLLSDDVYIEDNSGGNYESAVWGYDTNAVIIVWRHRGVNGDNILAQSIDENGARLWGVDNRVNTRSGAVWQGPFAIAADKTGGAAVVWYDERNGAYDIYGKYLDADGNDLWAADIRINSGSAKYQSTPAVAVDSSGNLYVVWEDYRNMKHNIYAQRLDVSGDKLWLSDVRVNSDIGIAPRSPRISVDDGGNVVVVWGDYRNGQNDIYAQWLNSEGDRFWSEDLQVNAVTGSVSSSGLSPLSVSTGSGRAIISWEDVRNGPTYPYDYDIYAQLIDASGVRLWNQDMRVNSDLGIVAQNSPDVSMKDDTAIVVWTDMRDGESGIYSQQVDTNGNKLWAQDIRVDSVSGRLPSVAIDNSGVAFVSWSWYSGGINDSYAQRIDANGSKLWSQDFRVSYGNSTRSYGYGPSVSIGLEGYANVIWHDSRNGNWDIYAQRVDNAGNLLWGVNGRKVVSPDLFYLPTGIAQSRTIDTLAADITQATLTADTALNGGSVQFYLTNNGGATWAAVTPGVTHVFTTTGSDLRWRAVLTGDPLWRHRSPVVNSLRIEYSSGSAGGDDYEPDDTCAQASPIQVNGAAQRHNFHQYQDSDWVWFDGQAGVVYIIQTSNTGPRADTVLELYNTCGAPPIDEDDNAFGPGATLAFTAPASGRYYVRVLQDDGSVYGPDTDYDLSVRAQQPTGAAIIVAGRWKLNDGVQPIIEATADWAYQALRQGGFAPENILYLSTATGKPDIDGTPTKANVRDAIQDWARARVGLGAPLWLYLADHGEVDRFYNEVGEVITAAELNLWLSNLEATSGVDQINVIVDACFSGSFIDTYQRGNWGLAEITGHGRVVVASTTSRWWAYAPRGLPGQPVPLMYFSDGLWRALGQGHSLWDAFLAGRATVEAGGQRCGDYDYSCQRPWLDDTGDAWFDASDGLEAQMRGLGASFGGGIAPYIDWLTVSEVNAGQTTVRAQVRDDGEVTRVWARVFAPSFTPPESADGTIPVIEVPEVELTRESGDVFSVAYPGFTEAGVYQVVLYAQDDDGYTSIPRWVLVGERRVYLPLVLR